MSNPQFLGEAKSLFEGWKVLTKGLALLAIARTNLERRVKK